MKRPRIIPPATPEEALKGLSLSAEHSAMLASGMLKIHDEVLDYEGLARASPNLKERMLALRLARTALANLTKAFATPFRNDLIEAEEELWEPRRRVSIRKKSVVRKTELFLKLLPVMKRYIDAMTADDIRQRWSDDDRRAVNLRRIDYETGAALDLVQKIGFEIDPPDPKTLRLIRSVLAFTGQKPLSISAVRKRLTVWKTLGKQDIYAFHES